jgi:hypothetical protein
MDKVRFRLVLLLLIIMLMTGLLTGCGKDGGDNGTPPPAESSNWDEMKWDQDKWG